MLNGKGWDQRDPNPKFIEFCFDDHDHKILIFVTRNSSAMDISACLKNK
jgi:hypothetical protein